MINRWIKSAGNRLRHWLIGLLGDYGKLLEKDLALLQSKAF